MHGLLPLLVVGAALGWSGGVMQPPAAAEDGPARAPSTVYLVGDSTVKNGSDAGSGQLWGWGHFLGEQIDPAKYRVENRALGGQSSRTYRTDGLWGRVVAQLQRATSC